MGKVHTTVLCDEELKNLAQARKINLSAALEEALRVRLAVPEEKEGREVVIAKLENQLKYLKSKEYLEAQKALEIEAKEAAAQKVKDVNALRSAFAHKLKTGKTEGYQRVLRAYCEKYKVELAQVVALAESKPKEGE